MKRESTHRIACLWVPHFMVQVEQQRLQKDKRPLLICQENQIVDACGHSVSQGVRRKQSLQQALTHCPTARVVEAEPHHYRAIWHEALEKLAVHSPTLEDARLGVVYLEAQGLGDLYSNEGCWAQAVLGELQKATSIDARLGLAGSRFATWIAARTSAVPPAYQLVTCDDRSFLAPLVVDWLPLAQETRRRLHILGLHTLGQFAEQSPTAICEQFGAEYLRFHRWTRGEDEGSLQGGHRRILDIYLDFEEPENRRAALLEYMEKAVWAKLRETHIPIVNISNITLQARLFEGGTWEKSLWVGSALGPIKLREIIEYLLVDMHGEGAGVAQVHLTLTGLEPTVGKQLDLFAHSEERLRLERTLETLNKKYPPGYITCVEQGFPLACLVSERYKLGIFQP